MSDRPEANLPIIAGQEQTVAASFLGLHSDLSSPDQLESNIVYSGTASGDARQIVGPVSTTFTGPIERVEAHFTLRANDEVPKTTFKFLKWLSPLNQSAIHSTNLRSQAPGTGSWFLEGCEFQTWLREPASLLWIHGGVGCGKTVLCSSATERIRTAQSQHDSELGFVLCYFYCSFQDQFRGTLNAILRALIAKLCTKDHVPSPLRTRYEKCHKEYPPEIPTNDQLISIVFAILDDRYTPFSQPPASTSDGDSLEPNQKGKQVYLLIDALDELPRLEQDEVLLFLRNLAHRRHLNLHVLVTSRDQSTITEALIGQGEWSDVLVDKTNVNDDIQTYISYALESEISFLRQPIDAKDLILTKLTERSKGMFRWAALQISALKRLNVMNHQTIASVLTKLPKDLDETYERILFNIDEELIHEATMALKWLLLPTRPLYIEELAEACAIHWNKAPIIKQDSRLTSIDIFDMLHDLITIEPPLSKSRTCPERMPTVAISHSSVQEFLMGTRIASSSVKRFQILPEQGHLSLARSFLSYLYHFNTYLNRHDEYPLREYAWYHWEKHIHPSEEALKGKARTKAVRLYNDVGTLSTMTENEELMLAIKLLPKHGMEALREALNFPFSREDYDLFFANPVRPIFTAEEATFFTILPCLDTATPLRVRLNTVRLADQPVFDAISHSWKDFKGEGSVWIGSKPVDISAFLVDILRRVRSHQELVTRSFWVDTICVHPYDPKFPNPYGLPFSASACDSGVSSINLHSHTAFDPGTPILYKGYAGENAHGPKYRAIASVFEQAREVIVGLGRESKTDGFEIGCLRRLASAATSMISEGNLPGLKAEFDALVLEIDRHERGWSSIQGLFTWPWWQRRWIVQAVVLAKNTTLLYGTISLNFDTIEKMILLERLVLGTFERIAGSSTRYRLAKAHPGWQAALSIAKTRRDYRNGTHLTFPTLLCRFPAFEVSDPLHQIRPFLYLLTPMYGVLYLDYTSKDSAINTDLPHHLLRSNDSLDILSYRSSYIKPLSSFPTKSEHSPSWRPSLFDVPHIEPFLPRLFERTVSLPLFCAGLARSIFLYDLVCDSSVLIIRGVKFDEIASISGVYPQKDFVVVDEGIANGFVNHTMNYFNTYCSSTSALNNQQSNQPQVEIFWRTILADQWEKGERLEQEYTSSGSTVPPRNQEQHRSLLRDPVLAAHLSFIKGCQLITTKRGFLDPTHVQARKGDIVAVFPRGTVPYVLCPVSKIRAMMAFSRLPNKDDLYEAGADVYSLYKFVGECYVHGIMDGETMKNKSFMQQPFAII